MTSTIRHRGLALTCAIACGCMAPQASVPSIAPDLRMGAMAQRTSFEMEPPRTATSSGAPASTDEDGVRKANRRRKALFWTGIAMGSIGGLGVLAFGITGRVMQGKLKSGYADGDLTRAQEDRYERVGEISNGVAIGSAIAGIVGFGMAAIVYGVDHARCGDLKPRRAGCPGAEKEELEAAPEAPPVAPEGPEQAPAPAEPGEAPSDDDPGTPTEPTPANPGTAPGPAPAPGTTAPR
jgi:hypothetical protein